MDFQKIRGSNGIVQLIALLETCTIPRRQRLLESLAIENPAMAALVKTKVLCIDHIATWTSVELRKLTAELEPTLRNRLFSTLENKDQHLKLKELGVHKDAKIKISPSEQHEQLDILIVQKAREMERIGTLEISHFDPAKSMFDQVA